MKLLPLVLLCSSACLIALLTSCGSGSSGAVSENTAIRGYNPGVGPFDSNGNYVESWADDKRKGKWWRKGRTTVAAPSYASKKPAPVKKVKKTLQIPAFAATPPKPKPPVYTPPVYKAPTYKPTVYTPPKPAYKAPKPVVKAKPKPVAKPTVKVTPKRRAPVRYVVSKGDTLWSISQKYKTSVAAIQTANGLSNNNISPGKVLLIPQY